MNFSEIYERVLVTPLFSPFAAELISRLNPVHEERRFRVPDHHQHRDRTGVAITRRPRDVECVDP
jgi:hypothetical protein